MLARRLSGEPISVLRLLPPRSPRTRSDDAVLEADRLAQALRVVRDGLVVPLAAAAHALVAEQAWTPFGYARPGDFAREHLGRSGRWLRDLAALHEGITSQPALEPALRGADGAAPLGRCAALWIARTANANSTPEWIELARARTAREFRQAIRDARRAGSTSPVPDPGDGTAGVNADDDEWSETEHFRLRLPRPARVAFETARTFHAVLVGRETPIAAFVEAVLAEGVARGESAARDPELAAADDESLAAAAPGESSTARTPGANGSEAAHSADPDVLHARVTTADHPDVLHAGATSADDPDPLHAGATTFPGRRARQRRAAHVVANALPIAELEALLARAEAASRVRAELDLPQRVEQLAALVQLEDEIERALGRLLAGLDACGAWPELGCRGLGEYAEDRLGWTHSTAAARAWLARSLDRLPQVRSAYEAGAIGFEAAVLVRRALGHRSVDPGLESAWVRLAQEATIKRLRDELHLVELQRVDQPAATCFPPATDAAWHAALHRAPGETRQRLACLIAAAFERRNPDVLLAFDLPEDLARRWRLAIDASCRGIAARTGSPAAAWAGMLHLVWDFTATWDEPSGAPKRTWDAIYARDDWRCMAPGCTGRINLHDHHVVYRAHQGSDEPHNQICLCAFHHQQGEHGGLARVRGKAPLGLLWRLGALQLGRWYRNERRVPAP